MVDPRESENVLKINIGLHWDLGVWEERKGTFEFFGKENFWLVGRPVKTQASIKLNPCWYWVLVTDQIILVPFGGYSICNMKIPPLTLR